MILFGDMILIYQDKQKLNPSLIIQEIKTSIPKDRLTNSFH